MARIEETRRWRRSRGWVAPARRDRQDEHQGNEPRDRIVRTRVALGRTWAHDTATRGTTPSDKGRKHAAGTTGLSTLVPSAHAAPRPAPLHRDGSRRQRHPRRLQAGAPPRRVAIPSGFAAARRWTRSPAASRSSTGPGYGNGDYYPKEEKQYLWADYQKATGDTPKFILFENDDAGFTKVASGTTYDIVHPCAYRFQDYVDLGAMQPWDTSLIPNFSAAEPRAGEGGSDRRPAVLHRRGLGLHRAALPRGQGRAAGGLLVAAVRRPLRRQDLVDQHAGDARHRRLSERRRQPLGHDRRGAGRPEAVPDLEEGRSSRSSGTSPTSCSRTSSARRSGSATRGRTPTPTPRARGSTSST